MKKKMILRIIGIFMALVAIVFVAFALSCPTLSFPWSNVITYMLYGMYAVVTTVLIVAPVEEK